LILRDKVILPLQSLLLILPVDIDGLRIRMRNLISQIFLLSFTQGMIRDGGLSLLIIMTSFKLMLVYYVRFWLFSHVHYVQWMLLFILTNTLFALLVVIADF